MYGYDWSKLIISLIIDGIIDTSTWMKRNQYSSYIDLKVSSIRKPNPLVPTLICLYVFADKGDMYLKIS